MYLAEYFVIFSLLLTSAISKKFELKQIKCLGKRNNYNNNAITYYQALN